MVRRHNGNFHFDCRLVNVYLPATENFRTVVLAGMFGNCNDLSSHFKTWTYIGLAFRML